MLAQLTALLSGPAIAWFLIVFLLIEGLLLGAVWRRSAKGLPPGQIISFLGAGLGFAFALLAVLSGWSPFTLGIALLAAFIFHSYDIVQRWQR